MNEWMNEWMNEKEKKVLTSRVKGKASKLTWEVWKQLSKFEEGKKVKERQKKENKLKLIWKKERKKERKKVNKWDK